MKTYLLEREQLIPRPISEVFEFFNKPENLESITPKSLKFSILTPKPIQMMTGAVIDYKIKTFGLWMRWTSIITDYLPPYKFVDTQIKGPYAFWHHTHIFREKGNGTSVIDRVHYAIPYGPLGQVLHTLFIKKQLQFIFDHRAKVIEEMFERKSELTTEAL